jgi:Acyl-CoA reductase (LuxC)
MDERYRNFDNVLEVIGEMTLEDRVAALVQLGETLKKPSAALEAVIQKSYLENKWFSVENQQKSIAAITEHFLSEKKIRAWLAQYPALQSLVSDKKTVAIVMAGNIPLVGLHDLICVFAAGHRSLIKLSDKDKFLLPYLVAELEKINPHTANYFAFSERLANFDAVIATGSNNTARYFETYFSKYKNIIRKNRNSVAILSGNETQEEMIALGSDIFDYFGLGCRNVSKIYVPSGYDFNNILEVWHDAFKEMVLHDKYKNNFDYNYALFMLNRIPLFNNGCVILREEKVLSSRIASLHYEFYDDAQLIENELVAIENQLQCVVTHLPFTKIKTYRFGQTQSPTLSDYADNVDVMKWLYEA